MHLDVDTNMLPLVIGAPEYLEQKAVADACTAVALGWLVHVAPVPSITGSDVVVKYKGVNSMSKNKKVVPEAKQALNQLKLEVSSC